ncbi:hypothetical protein NXS19_006238 [Fusarium pseudograminearum]|nr:hypothetical protein NXS19_006238 [Fusarium pseudograminearum]
MANPTLVIVPGSFAPAKITPSVGRKEGRPPATMSDDAQEISNVVSKLLDEGQDVVLMTHSYGGSRSGGKKGGIEKLVYLTSMVLQPGTSNLEAFGGALPDFLTMEDDYMSLDAEVNASLTFSDLPADQALELAKKMEDHSTPSFKEKLTYPGYNDVERLMIEGIKVSTQRDVTIHTLESGHVPITSQPENMAKIVEKVFKA